MDDYTSGPSNGTRAHSDAAGGSPFTSSGFPPFASAGENPRSTGGAESSPVTEDEDFPPFGYEDEDEALTLVRPTPSSDGQDHEHQDGQS